MLPLVLVLVPVLAQVVLLLMPLLAHLLPLSPPRYCWWQ